MNEIKVNEQVKAKLIDAYCENNVDIKIAIPEHRDAIDTTIELYSELPRDDYSLAELMEYSFTCGGWGTVNISEARALSALYPYYVNMEALINRKDNLLTMTETKNWVQRFHSAVAKMVLVHGTPISLQESPYKWEDNTTLPDPSLAVAVFNVKEDEWGVFGGTNYGFDKIHGMSADVVYSNGYSRRVRVEGTLMEIMHKLG